MRSRSTKRIVGVVAMAASLFVAPVDALASTATTNYGTINFMVSGYAANQLRVQLNATFSNPDSCQYTDGYITNPSDPGVSLYHAQLLTAYASQQSFCSSSAAVI